MMNAQEGREDALWVISKTSSGPKKLTVWVPASVPPRRAWMPISFFSREKKTPVKVYIKERRPVDYGSAQVFGDGAGKVVFGDWRELGPPGPPRPRCGSWLPRWPGLPG